MNVKPNTTVGFSSFKRPNSEASSEVTSTNKIE
jgi:hypothetical protein